MRISLRFATAPYLCITGIGWTLPAALPVSHIAYRNPEVSRKGREGGREGGEEPRRGDGAATTFERPRSTVVVIVVDVAAIAAARIHVFSG